MVTATPNNFSTKPRHVEAQVWQTAGSSILVLGTRDCSCSAAIQKLVEKRRPRSERRTEQRIHDAAQKIIPLPDMWGAGTVEFLLSRDGLISFLEVNTRLQVEHPVTEVTTGIDIVVEPLHRRRAAAA